MKKRFIIKKNFEFTNIINKNQKYGNQYFSIYVSKSNLNHYRFGISVPKKIGKAVVRNKIKRQIKSILKSNKNYFKVIDYVIIVKKGLLDLNYQVIKNKLISLLFNLGKEFKDEN